MKRSKNKRNKESGRETASREENVRDKETEKETKRDTI